MNSELKLMLLDECSSTGQNWPWKLHSQLPWNHMVNEWKMCTSLEHNVEFELASYVFQTVDPLSK